MKREQKIVAAGAFCGAVAMLLAMWLLFAALSPAPEGGSADRLAYAASWSSVAALPLLLMVAAVAHRRFTSEAIDPTLGREDRSIDIDRRVAANSSEQLLLFLAGSFASAPVLPREMLHLIAAAAITFAGARMIFWVGYRAHPLLRAFGMAATFYLNIGLIAAALWLHFA